MAKREVSWYREGLVHWFESLKDQENNIKRLQAAYDRSHSEALFLERQCNEADHQGKTSFDAEKFLVVKRKVTNGQ